jgi:Rrf2 family iron-sulfur cluster assembly transcriptional regulator
MLRRGIFTLALAPNPPDNVVTRSPALSEGELMKLTTACTYALRALVFLARHQDDGLVAIRAIAEAEGLSAGFLSNVLKPLVSANLLLSMRGPNGGYRLARPAKRIRLLDVVEAVDGPVRGGAPRVGLAGAGAQLDDRLRQACEAAAEVARSRLRKVSVADLSAKGPV